MPLKESASPAAVGENIRELHQGPQYAATRKKHGADVANKQAIAIALETQRQAGGGAKMKKTGAGQAKGKASAGLTGARYGVAGPPYNVTDVTAGPPGGGRKELGEGAGRRKMGRGQDDAEDRAEMRAGKKPSAAEERAEDQAGGKGKFGGKQALPFGKKKVGAGQVAPALPMARARPMSPMRGAPAPAARPAPGMLAHQRMMAGGPLGGVAVSPAQRGAVAAGVGRGAGKKGKSAMPPKALKKSRFSY